MAQPSAEYEALVRQQLVNLGYNSAAISDDVLREFLADFEEKVNLGEDAAAAPLSYPTALKPAEAATARARGKAGAGGSKSGAATTRARVGSTKPIVSSKPKQPVSARAPLAPKASKPAAPKSDASAGAAALTAAPPVPPLPVADVSDPVDAENVANGADASSAAPVEVPAFEKAHWESLRPKSARAALGGGKASASPRVGGSALFDGRAPLGSMSGVIISSSSLTPRRPKSDPVSMFAKRQQQWSSDSFLTATSGTKRVGRLIEPASPPVPLRKIGRKHNDYVIPTSRRRDDLVWQTRMRMRQTDADANGIASKSPRSKQLTPNLYQPVTEKRRDDLRWAVRTEMALAN